MFSDIISNYYPQDWTPMNLKPHEDYKLVDIWRRSRKYRELNGKVAGDYKMRTTKIVRVQNPYLYGQFLLKKEEYTRFVQPKIFELFHDTSEYNIPSIVSGNLDWRLANRVKFGKGVSFSPDPTYASNKSNWNNGSERAMIIADVLVGHREYTHESKKLPKNGADTSIGNHNRVYVKYYDNEFYPKYVVFYESAD